MKEKKIQLYTYIRVLATILVVIGHCSTLSLINKNGVSNIDLNNIPISTFFELLRKIIYSFHMPLYVSLSGAVFAYTLKNMKILEFINKKFKRLIIPYFITSTFLFFPVRILTNYYEEGNLIKQYFLDVILSMDINYLWYLIMLFEISILFYFLFKKEKCSSKHKNIKLIILLLISIASFALPVLPFQIHRTMEFGIWFYIGTRLEHYRINMKKIDKKIIFLLVVIFILAFILNTNMEAMLNNKEMANLIKNIVKIIKMGIRYVMEFSAVICAYLIFGKIKESNNKILSVIDKYSMSIYLYHIIFIFIFKWLLYKFDILNSISNISFCILIIIEIIIGIILPILFSKIVDFFKRKKV